MYREILELKNHKTWICQCGTSNSIKTNKCRSCKIDKDRYPERMNCLTCQRILENFKEGDVCPYCFKNY